MFHMLTCFNLEHDVTIDEFHRSLATFATHLASANLIHSTGPIGRRQADTIMDTDDERDHEFFFIMSFRDRAQCDRAIQHILPRAEPAATIHEAVFSKIRDQVFICWEDMEGLTGHSSRHLHGD